MSARLILGSSNGSPPPVPKVHVFRRWSFHSNATFAPSSRSQRNRLSSHSKGRVAIELSISFALKRWRPSAQSGFATVSPSARDRKSGGEGKSGYGRVNVGG